MEINLVWIKFKFIFCVWRVIFVVWLGENTLRGGQDCCHIVLFFRGPMIELQPCHYYEGFSQSFACYGKSKPSKSNFKEITFLNLIWCDVKIYLCQKNIHHNILKNENILKKWLKWFLVFMKFVVSIKHCDSIWLE